MPLELSRRKFYGVIVYIIYLLFLGSANTIAKEQELTGGFFSQIKAHQFFFFY